MFEKKRNLFFFKRIFLFLILFQCLINFSSALTVIPASISVDFQPNFEQTFDYRVSGTKQGSTYSLYAQGDLAEYVTLNKKELKGDGDFKVFLSLPASIEKPGKHALLIGIKELFDEEISGGIGTALEIRVLISVYVPYPGKYVEMSFSSENVNLGEPLQFKVDAVNRGKEDLIIYPRIEIFSEQGKEKIETLSFEDRALATTQKISLYKSLDTSSYNPGRYSATAIIEYGGASPSTAETFFRIGDLSIEIKNYTQKILLDENIQKFNIDIESGWNDKIDGVYADVSFFNKTSEVLFFKTTSTNLNPWEVKTITGYVDTLNFQPGVYDANITLFYYGKDVGKSSSKLVQVEFIKKISSNLMIILISLVSLIVLLVVILILKRKFFQKK